MQKIIDIHSHPSLKTYLYDIDLTKRNKSAKDFDIFNSDYVQTDIPKMTEGGLNAAVVAHYLPEIGFLKYCKLIRSVRCLLEAFLKQFVEKVEKETSPEAPFVQTLKILKKFEEKAAASPNAVIPKSYQELTDALQDNKRIFIHAVEGGHSLGRKLGTTDKYLENLQTLYDAGVCMLTIAHFFENDLAACLDGMPPSIINLLGCKRPTNSKPGLSKTGEAVVEFMLDKGMVVDLTHCTFDARKRVYEINKKREKQGKSLRPLVFSHAGVRTKYNNRMNPSVHEIQKIKECEGVIGVIFMNYWLTGREEEDLLGIDIFEDKGVEYIVDTIKEIKHIAGSYDNIAIGTDFDGFTDPPDNLQDCSKMPKLIERLNKIEGINQDDIDKITYKNALRVLEKGWGK
ncbi:MAG: rane dipeptidase [Bacteroidota bacterium]|nr:rane dipeptidase [Bacteroidota bacterium]